MKVVKSILTGAVLVALSVPHIAFGAVAVDSDIDGLSDKDERKYMTDPRNPDTDGDGFLDGLEVIHDYSPHLGGAARLSDHDYEGDELNDWVELQFGTDISKFDTDRDGVSDREEILRGTDPTDDANKNELDRKIVVDLSSQQLYFYVNDVSMLQYPVSTGNPWTPTPVGTFEIERKLPVARYVGADYDFPGVKWNMQFKPRYYLHGAYWHNDFGKRTRSHGCVNMRTEDAGELYQYIENGISVEIIGETPKNLYVEA